jgi:hypothetical protein
MMKYSHPYASRRVKGGEVVEVVMPVAADSLTDVVQCRHRNAEFTHTKG